MPTLEFRHQPLDLLALAAECPEAERDHRGFAFLGTTSRCGKHQKIHHEGTKHTKGTKERIAIVSCSFVSFVTFVPSW